jgi:3alpha(or 20beta)-hydroxysteroid dehydrogenase
MRAARFDGRVALITGAARGQGAVEAGLFLDEGARVVLIDVLGEELDQTASVLAEKYPGAVASRRLDVSSEDDWAEAIDLVRSEFGALHVLVHNAAITESSSIEDLTTDAWRRILAVNLDGVFFGTRAAAPLMRESARALRATSNRASGSIVVVSSATGIRVSAGAGAYATSKWAVRGFAKVAALELAPYVRVNSVHPGPILTPMISPMLDDGNEILSRIVADVPLGRIGQPEEVADVVLFLASDEASYCTGSEFLVEGGRIAGPPAPH